MDQKPKNNTDRKYIMLGLRIASDFGATIAVPLIISVLIGQWLDAKYDSAPKFLILAFIVAAVLSTLSIKKKARNYGREYESIEKKSILQKTDTDK